MTDRPEGTTLKSMFARDAVERVFWTLVQALLGVITVDALDLPTEWMAVVVPLFTLLKVLAAKKVGDPRTAAILPEE